MKMDIVSDFLTRLRNANSARLDFVKVPYSKINFGIISILLLEGYIQNFCIDSADLKHTIIIKLKYSSLSKHRGMFLKLERISRSSKRVYCGFNDLRKILPQFQHGFFIISTTFGILHERQLYEYRVGGEILCYIE